MIRSVTALFDTHCHLDRLGADVDAERVVERARLAGVGGWLLPGVRRQHWPDLVAIAGREADAWAAPGLHPMMASQWDAAAELELGELLQRPECLAVGEIGLDGLLEVPRELQEQAFRGQLRLAIEIGKPVLVHCRRAWGQVVDILRQEQADRVGGILHGFGGSLEIARQALSLGFVVAFGGPLTYTNARRNIEVLQGLPAEMIVIETDAPDLPPHPHRNEQNRPEWLSLIAARVAELKGWSLEETARVTTENARRILHL